jgi:ABC-type lipoprotein export system ATPase subunit
MEQRHTAPAEALIRTHDIGKVFLSHDVVTHAPRDAEHADRTVQLFDGRVLEKCAGVVR